MCRPNSSGNLDILLFGWNFCLLPNFLQATKYKSRRVAMTRVSTSTPAKLIWRREKVLDDQKCHERRLNCSNRHSCYSFCIVKSAVKILSNGAWIPEREIASFETIPLVRIHAGTNLFYSCTSSLSVWLFNRLTLLITLLSEMTSVIMMKWFCFLYP